MSNNTTIKSLKCQVLETIECKGPEARRETILKDKEVVKLFRKRRFTKRNI